MFCVNGRTQQNTAINRELVMQIIWVYMHLEWTCVKKKKKISSKLKNCYMINYFKGASYRADFSELKRDCILINETSFPIFCYLKEQKLGNIYFIQATFTFTFIFTINWWVWNNYFVILIYILIGNISEKIYCIPTAQWTEVREIKTLSGEKKTWWIFSWEWRRPLGQSLVLPPGGMLRKEFNHTCIKWTLWPLSRPGKISDISFFLEIEWDKLWLAKWLGNKYLLKSPANANIIP